MNSLQNSELFQRRHIAPTGDDVSMMLKMVGSDSIEDLISETVPASIRLVSPLQLPVAKTESEYLDSLRQTASKNIIAKSFIGQGYYNTITPSVIRRNILENPGWYTQYTPYQPEISQGRLQALLNFQTMVTSLTALPVANASLLDEGTAAAEAMFLQFSQRKDKAAKKYWVSPEIFPQTLDVLRTRSAPLGIELHIAGHEEPITPGVFGAIVQYPAANGSVYNYEDFARMLEENGVSLCVIADLMSLALLKPPGEFGADIAVGTTQRFGVPMGYGGPHAAYLAVKEDFKRFIPGRVIGVSEDTAGNYALRMALQTREQHIRRDKATSNICTAQALLAIMAGMYAAWHGQEGIRAIAGKIHSLTVTLSQRLAVLGMTISNETYFDTIKIEVGNKLAAVHREATKAGLNFNYGFSSITLSLDESTSEKDLDLILSVFEKALNKKSRATTVAVATSIPEALQRTSAFLDHPVFNSYHSEHEMLRYIKSLEAKDLSLCHSMIPLGSCTMKLNATTEMLPLTWPEFSSLHPFAPAAQTQGYKQIFDELEDWLCEITGFDAMSLQPNSGAQGEYAGLMVIRAYHRYNGQAQRNTVLIPASAHGTNPASAAMAGMKIVVVKCDTNGNIDFADLQAKAEEYKETLSCLMVTYPSTHGVYEEGIKEICAVVHKCGGQVYMDGANMNAQVGLTSPASIGADVCHLNLHKTFCIPHGGGGPGMGPIGVAAHLKGFLPGHSQVDINKINSISAVSAAPWGSASILLISHAYIAMMGAEGLKDATMAAILNANYIKARLEDYYPVLYSGANGRCAHEMILDCREFKKFNIEVTDIAKRLMDYGFHAPTVSFPVAGTLMVEPTESESKAELDRFCDSMIAIKGEIDEVATGLADEADNVLKNAPHTLAVLTTDNWDRPYSRHKAAYPLDWIATRKFWPSVGRVNESKGDRNLICSCPPIETYTEEVLMVN
ncbi:aminomethyl-transferring glycine dehydrogenase [Desertivirga brevis]|uniref:aminomethyl-transferring glycine dehydrogenase n=1 Tax=Desertivirga brevis TaxID=2810310 RepID=UPI001A97AEDB|nr:aminomethyl-transferring glycine dehydrogenase [Pedobacter sp. SYSU D00873]